MSSNPQKVAIVNLSKEVQHDAGMMIANALAVQVTRDAAAPWEWAPVSLSFADDPECAEDGACHVVLVDGLDVLGAYGYHSVGPNGLPFGRVDVAECLAMGGQILSGNNGVSTVASHEVLELLGDPTAAVWVPRPDGAQVPLELCDACQGFSYGVTVNGQRVDVADFLLPAYFGQLASVDVEAMQHAALLPMLRSFHLHADAEALEVAMADHKRVDGKDGFCEHFVDARAIALASVTQKARVGLAAAIAGARAPGPYDFLGRLTQQWEIGEGGYSVVSQNGKTTDVYGDERRMAARSSKRHSSSRSAKRRAQSERGIGR